MFLRRAGIQLVTLPTTTTASNLASSSSSSASTAAAVIRTVVVPHNAAAASSLPTSMTTSSTLDAFYHKQKFNANSNKITRITPLPPFSLGYGKDYPRLSPSPSSSKLSVIFGTTIMMGANKCKNYHRDHDQQHHRFDHRRLYHHLHLKSSAAVAATTASPVFRHVHVVSSSNTNSSHNNNNSSNNTRQFSCAKSARDHNNGPFSRPRSNNSNNNNNNGCSTTNFSTNSTKDGGEDGKEGSSSTSAESVVVTIKDGLSSRESADDFLSQLSDNQKQLIYHTLNIEILRDKYEGTLGSSRMESHHYLSRFGRPATQKEGISDPTGTLCEVSSNWLHQRLDEKAPPAPASAIWAVTVKNALPFIGFGFLDNLIMILAGDYIDITIGTALGISTMAAAALGNAISDVAGIGSAWYVEELASKVGIRDPDLTPSQMASGAVRWAANLGRAFGVMIGCLLGMFPLAFLPSAEEAKERKLRKEAEEEEKKKKADAASNVVDKGKFA